MHSIKIVLEAITEFHEPKDYEFFPSIRIDAWRLTGGSPESETLLIHRCEDCFGLPSSEDKGESLMAARDYLEDNYKAIIQALIAKIGE